MMSGGQTGTAQGDVPPHLMRGPSRPVPAASKKFKPAVSGAVAAARGVLSLALRRRAPFFVPGAGAYGRLRPVALPAWGGTPPRLPLVFSSPGALSSLGALD